jgi:hypothetical protein
MNVALDLARSTLKAEQAYRRSDALEKRRKLMEAWIAAQSQSG